MTAIIPIIFVLVIVAVMVGIGKGNANRQRKSMRSNRLRWVFGGYFAILLVCMVLVTITPTKEIADGKTIQIEVLEKESQNLFDAAFAGKIDSVDSKFIKKKWELNYPDQKLKVAVVEAEFLDSQIIVERKKMNDDKIEAVYYRTRTSVNGADITKKTKPLRLKLAGNTLSLINPKKVNLEFAMFNQAFTVTQFTGGDSFFEHSSDTFQGQSILYMRIPKDLELIGKSDLNLQFVE
jgi:hypothetical protein